MDVASYGPHGADRTGSDELFAWSRRMGPPENEVPVPAPFSSVVARTEDLAVCLVGSRAYTTGFELDVAVRFRTTPKGPLGDRVFELVSGHGPSGLGRLDERLLLGVEYPDGRTATNVGFAGQGELPDGPPAPDHLVLVPRGGGGGGRTYDESYWVSPLPPAGSVTFVCAWPAFGIDEVSVAVDATALAAAGARATVLWEQAPADDGEDEPFDVPEGLSGWFARALRRRGR